MDVPLDEHGQPFKLTVMTTWRDGYRWWCVRVPYRSTRHFLTPQGAWAHVRQRLIFRDYGPRA